MKKPAIIAIDIDHFKEVNEIFGKKIADKLKNELEYFVNSFLLMKFNDSLYSYHFSNLNSDEFYIFFNEDDSHEAYSIAFDLLNEIEKNDWNYLIQDYKLTCSAGVAYRKKEK